ncbi:MAG: noncanonical pyrimidine nucleotidase, YjjG family protein [bacterium]|nr:MAG: noncanonical pyrimidine nucleotidase, YjjG family protein [bacterium]
MPQRYQHLFFDLDRTLWDFDKSSLEAFEEIFENYQLAAKGIDNPKDLHEKYSVHNRKLWDLYREGILEKNILRWKRFYLTLLDYDIDDKTLAEKMGTDYVEISPRKVNLFPHVLETLEYLASKYHLHLITNGFQEVQQVKIKVSGMDKYFEKLITSEEAGVKKPDPRIFYYAFDKTGALADESLMIGDDYSVDIAGARQVGMDQVFFDPDCISLENNCTYKVDDLLTLCEIL